MAVLALSVVGAGLSSAMGFGATAGWLVGSLIGNLLFQKKGPNTEGPRLTDLTVQSSTEGAPIPIVFGRMRIAGNMIWSSGIQEVKTKKKQGGKGMGGSSTHTTYTYHASFAIGLCEGPIQGIRRIWADGKLIYSNAANASAATLYASKKKMGNLTFYLGTETQGADPIIAANVGSVNCPGFRGLAYVVFDRLQLADFGNRIPNLTFEVVTGTEGTHLWRVNTWTADTIHTFLGWEFTNGIIYRSATSWTGSSNIWRTRTRTYDLAGNKLSDVTGPPAQYPWDDSGAVQRTRGRVRLGRVFSGSDGIVNGMLRWLWDDNVTAPVVTLGTFGNNPSPKGDGDAGFVYFNGYVFTGLTSLYLSSPRGAANGIARYPVDRGVAISKVPDKYIDISTAPGGLGFATPRGSTSTLVRSISISDEGTLILAVHPENVITYHRLEFDVNLNFIKGYTYLSNSAPDVCIVVKNGRFWVSPESGGGGTTRIKLHEEQSPGQLTFIKFVNVGVELDAIHSLGNGMVFARDGVFQIYPPVTPSTLTVGSIVDAICERCGIDSGKRLTSSLTQTIEGYMIPNPMTGRAAIEPLQQGYFFDATESDYTAKFIKRPGTIVATLESGDLGAGIDRPATDDFKRRRMQELELPVEVRVSYLDVNNDFLPGMQAARRLITQSKHSVELQLPIAMTSTQAAQIADIMLRNVWAERDTYEFYLTREFAQLDPTDLLSMPDGNTVRVSVAEFTDPGLVKVTALRDISGGYTSNAVGNSTSHEYPQEVPIIGPTEIEFLDIPPLRDMDAVIPGFYVAVHGPLAGWKGAELTRSADNDVTYTNLDVITSAATVGVTTTILRNPPLPFTFDLGDGVEVIVNTPGATLSSVSDTALLAGANAMLIGQEVIQFGVATLVSAQTYRLTRLLRGRLGTEQYTGTHTAGERCILLDEDIRFVEDGQSNLNVEMLYKAISFGATNDEVIPEPFTNTGNSMKNPRPIFTGSNLHPSNGTWTITWNARVRANWWWQTGGWTHLPVDTTEQYQVEVYDPVGVLKNTYTTAVQQFVYTRAQQIADFGYPVLAFEVRVATISNYGIRGHQASLVPRTVQRGRYIVTHLAMCPVLYWRRIFDATPDDYSTSNYDGTSSGLTYEDPDVPVVNEVAGTSVVASASTTTGYMQRARSSSPLLNIVKPFSLYIWVKYTNTDTQRAIMGCWDSVTSADQAWRLGSGTTAGSLRFQVNIGGTIRAAQHAGSYNDGNWHQVVGVYEADGSVKLYVDGILRDTTTGAYGDTQLGVANFRVGQNSNGTDQFVGKYFGVAVHERPLPANVVLDLYNTAKGIP